MGIAPTVVDALVNVGRSGVPTVPECLRDPHEAWRTLMCGHEPWREVARRLSVTELELLMRGMILYNCSRPGSSGGSVSPVIVLYHEYADRRPEGERELVEWIFAHRQGEYEPFGTLYDEGARTLDEFHARSFARKARAQQRRAAQDISDKEARALRMSFGAAQATRYLANAVRRGDEKAVLALLAKGADPGAALGGDSLVQHALANGRERMAALLRERVVK